MFYGRYDYPTGKFLWGDLSEGIRIQSADILEYEKQQTKGGTDYVSKKRLL